MLPTAMAPTTPNKAVIFTKVRMHSSLVCRRPVSKAPNGRYSVSNGIGVARDYEINPSSLHRHRVNCLRLGSANAIKKEAARGSAAVALLPSKETLSGAFSDLAGRDIGRRHFNVRF
jgi:hypothetical protein